MLFTTISSEPTAEPTLMVTLRNGPRQGGAAAPRGLRKPARTPHPAPWQVWVVRPRGCSLLWAAGSACGYYPRANPPTDGASQAGYATDVAKDLDRPLLLKAVEATTCG